MLAVLIAGGCGVDLSSDPPQTASPSAQATINDAPFVAEGLFATRRVVALEVENPDSAHLFTDPDEDWFTQQTTMYLRSRMSMDADGTIEIVEETCAIEISVIGGVDTVPGPGLLASLVEVHLAGDVAESMGVTILTTQPYPDIWGARLGDPLVDPLPQEPGDSTQWDQDLDGEPGVTVFLDVVDADIRWTTYVAQRVVFDLSGESVGPDRLSGRVNVRDAEQSLLDASPAWLAATEPNVRPSEDASLSYFEIVRIGEEISCDDLADSDSRAEVF